MVSLTLIQTPSSDGAFVIGLGVRAGLLILKPDAWSPERTAGNLKQALKDQNTSSSVMTRKLS